MPIVLFCPGCRTRLTVGDDRAGTTFDCPRCATVLAVPIVLPPPTPPASKPPPIPKPSPVVDYEPDDTPDPDYRPQRKKSKNGLWVALLTLLLMAAGAVVWLALREPRGQSTESGNSSAGTRSAPGAPSTTGAPVAAPVAPPDSWTHKELLDHLNRHGPKYEMEKTINGGFFGPAVYISPTDGSSVRVYVQVRSSAQNARDEAAVEGERAFAWGRFLFCGHRAELDLMRVALR